MFESKPEYIATVENFEVWNHKYTYEVWITDNPVYNIKENKYYDRGDLCFALISYLDDNGNYHYVNEKQYFIERF
jgi:hypothetical protein